MQVALSTASVYPESTAHGFELASRLGYDAVEVMVGIDPISQEVDAVRHLADYHQIPVCAVHAPCLLITQRVWGTDPWAKLEQSARMAEAVGADVVVVHPPFRWQRDYARAFVDGVADLADRTGVAFAVENMYPWRASRREMQAYVPGWDPTDQEYANATIDLSHSAVSRSDPVEMARRLGTWPTGPAPPRTSTWSPDEAPSRPRSSWSTWQGTGSEVTSWWRSTPAGARRGTLARWTCSSRWRSPG